MTDTNVILDDKSNGVEKSDLLRQYQSHLRKGEEVFRDKYEEIKRARQGEKQIIPESSLNKSTNTNYRQGNDDENDGSWGQSTYEVPLVRAIAEKILQEMTTNIFDHEYGGNNKIGRKARRALKRQLRKIYSLENIRKKLNIGLWHAINSGTLITQTITKKDRREVIYASKDDSGGYREDVIDLGRVVDLCVYDPLTVIPDFNAVPHDIKGTMKWCIVTLGQFTREWIEDKYDVKIQDRGDGRGTKIYDNFKQQIERNAGTNKNAQADTMVVLREYYTIDGMRYTIAGDQQIIDTSPNSNGIKGCIPINFAPLWLDPDSIFGQTLESLLRPSVDVVSSVMNQIIDMQSLNANMPFFYDKSLIPSLGEGLTVGQCTPREFIPVDGVNIGGTQLDIRKAIGRPEFPEMTQGALFVYEQAMKHIFYLTGFNEITLGGIQGKQIRNSDVANMINQASLKNSSKIVVQIETEFMNPTSWDILQIFSMYYDEFQGLSDDGVPREVLQDFSNVRVINGSSLPSDQVNRLAKVERMLQIGQIAPNTVDWMAILEDWFDALGVADESIYLLDPLQVVTEQQAMALVQLMQQEGVDSVINFITQTAQQGEVNG